LFEKQCKIIEFTHIAFFSGRLTLCKTLGGFNRDQKISVSLNNPPRVSPGVFRGVWRFQPSWHLNKKERGHRQYPLIVQTTKCEKKPHPIYPTCANEL